MKRWACGAAAVLFWVSLPATLPAQEEVSAESEVGVVEGSIHGDGKALGGPGISFSPSKEAEKTAKPSKKKDKGAPKFDPLSLFDKCDASDIGKDSLWKFPSESWKDGAAFITPKGACRGEEIKDKKGNPTGQYRLKRQKIASISMCSDILCMDRLEFEKFGFDENCVYRVHQGTWVKHFGAGPRRFDVVLMLDDSRRILLWDLVDPSARNGAPPFGNLKYKVEPACYTPKSGAAIYNAGAAAMKQSR